MKTKALLLFGKKDLRLEELELPEIKDDEILVSVISDSLCMSSYKAATQGLEHKRVPAFAAETGVMLGHEFAGDILKVGAKWKHKFNENTKYIIQPAINYDNKPYTPGYSYRYCGGDATYAILPNEVMGQDCLLNYKGDAYFDGSLAEPLSCVIGAFHACYHTTPGVYVHKMGPVEGGNMAILAGAGPMGLALADYAIHCEHRPSILVITDIDEARLKRAERFLSPAEAEKQGIKLVYLNTAHCADPVDTLRQLTGGKGFDDLFVYAPVESLIEQADLLLNKDGCLNFFAGPTDQKFSARFNFYNVHYASTHLVGTSGGNTDDMREAIEMMESGKLTPAILVTHIGGLDAAKEATLNLPTIPGGKKLIYTHIDMPLTAIDDFAELGKSNPVYARLAVICDKKGGLWCLEAEEYLLANAKSLGEEPTCLEK